MTSFGWKRRVGNNVLREASKTFEANSKDVEDEVVDSDDVDWISLAAKRKCLQLEDAHTKSARLRLDGITLAEAERFWEALHKWDEALQLTPSDEKLHEMRAQVLMSLGEVYPAVCAAEKAVSLNANWWVGHQTLGRAQLGLGEVKLAVKSFSRAVHINPANAELREDDLMWAVELVHRKASLDTAAASSSNATELDADVGSVEDDNQLTAQHRNSCSLLVEPAAVELDKLTSNHVIMRD